MAQIQNLLNAQIDPSKPVPEICAVISAVSSYHPSDEETKILIGVVEAIERRLNQLNKGDEN